ncbi:hypothetical protein Tco_0277547 [Tanacetum coccineum]
MRWAVEGDENSRFFHSLLKCKYASSNIKRIHVNGIWLDDPEEIKHEDADYFSSRFKEPLSSRPAFNSSCFRKLSDRDACFLESSITVLKYKEAVWGCAGSKAPGLFKGVYLANGANLSLLQYEDDALFFGDWSRLNAMHLIHILKCFELASGLKVNISKSKLIGVGVSRSEVDSLASCLGCASDSIPFIYLGLPVGKKIRYFDGWAEVTNRFRKRLSSWKANSLSIGGRLTLVKSVLDVFGGFKDSQRGISWVKWDSFLADAKNGVLVLEFYGEDGGFCSPSSSLGIGGLWCDILKAIKNIETIDPSFKDSFVIKVGNGNNILFWRDPWCSTGLRPMDIFLRLFALDTYKDCKVCDRWGTVNGVWGGMWSWRVPPRDISLDDIRTLSILIGDLRLLESENDKWTWSSDVSGSFRVKTLTKKIERHLLNGSMIGEHHVWNSWIPRKVNICT